MCLICSLKAWGCQGTYNGLCDSLGWQGGDFTYSASFLILNEIMPLGTLKVPLTALTDDPWLQLAGAGGQCGVHPDRRQRGVGLRRLPRRRHGRDTQAGAVLSCDWSELCNTDL